MAHIGKKDTFQFITAPGLTQGFIQPFFGILILLGTHADADYTERSFLQLPDIGGLGFEPLPTTVVTAKTIFDGGFVQSAIQLQG